MRIGALYDDSSLEAGSSDDKVATLGAQKTRVVKMVMREGVLFAAVGGAIGFGVGWFLPRLLSSLQYGVQSWDLAVYAAVPVLVLLVSAAATVMPPMRAVQIDPEMALRYE
jgi:ABC-type antimicrobial peptide transport system permease subunit